MMVCEKYTTMLTDTWRVVSIPREMEDFYEEIHKSVSKDVWPVESIEDHWLEEIYYTMCELFGKQPNETDKMKIMQALDEYVRFTFIVH